MSWGECYYDHFGKLFRDPVGRKEFSQGPGEHTIQILWYDNVFRDCRLFASFGLSHYSLEIGDVAEVIVPVEGEWDAVPYLLANCLFYMVQEHMLIGRGVCIGGVATLDPDFGERYQKTALYLTNPYGLPEDSGVVKCDGLEGYVYLGFFVSDKEKQFLSQHGAEAFEDMLEVRKIDPFNLRRPCSQTS